MQNTEDKKWLYEQLRDNGYDIGSQDEFYQGLDNYEEDAKWCYEQTQLLGLDVGSYDEFESSFRNKPTQDNSSNNPSANPLSERFSVAPDVSKPVETNEKPMLVGPSAPKPSFGIKSNIPTIAEMTQAKLEGRNSTPAYSMENRPQELTKFGEGVKQGTEQLGAGLEYAVGEAIAPVVGTSYDDKAALEEIERLQAEGKDVLEETKNITSLSSVAPATARALEFLGAKQGIKAAEKKAEVNRTIQQAIKDAGGDIDAAKSLLADRAGKITKADTIRQHAEATMAKAKPTKGWAWVGSMVPQMAAPVIGMGLTAVTKMPIFAQTLGRLNMGALTASTAGQAMAEARQAGATNADVWSAGIINGAIEYITEEIPFNHYTQRLANAAKNSATSAIKKMASEVGSPANKELQDLLAKANKQLDGKLLSGKNVSDYLADITAESISEGAAEGLQTISSIIYENPEDYPTLTEIINNSIEGLKGGLFMGSILGGASKTAEHRMNRNRRKQQGFVDVAEITLPNNKSAIIEIVTDENGNEVGYVDDVKIPITDNNVIRREQFSFDDFERGQFQLEQDEAYENGRTLETAEEMNDANNMLDITANEVRRIFGASEDSDVDAMLGDNPLQYALSEYDKDPEIGQTIIDYLNAKATADGVIGAAQDRIELEARKAGALIDSRKSESDGMVHPAKMKLDDRGVYIISGNVKLLDDGSVDTNNSDESIIIMDAATGEKSFATAKDLLSLDDAIDPEAEKSIVRENIAETIATEVENKMLGVLPMNVGDTFPVLADDGSQHTVQIVSNDGSGIVEVIMDNEAQTTSANKEIIQQMANAYNRNRAEQFAQGYKEQIQSENISQAPDTKVEESSAVIPLDKQGRPDFNAMEPDMFINEYVSRYGEDNAIKIARKNIEAARANIKKIDKKIDDVLDPNQMQSLFEQKSAAEAQLNRYNDILGRMGASEDANETEDEQRSRLKKESGNRIYNLFPDGLPNVESVILADIATGNRIRWSDKTTNGAVTSRGLAAELGLSDSNAERTRRLALISNSAPTPEEYAESLQERLNELGVRYDESSLRDTVLDVYSSVDTRSGAWEALEEIAAGSQQEDIDTDWEDMQKLVAYEKAQKQEEREQELPDISMTEDATPITEGEYAELEAQAQAEEQADYDAMMEEQTPPTVKVNHQGNPIDANGALITEKVESIDEITDEDFENPYRSVELPTLPQNVNDVIGANGKPVVIKKNIFERNIINHSDVTPEQSRDILKSALYSPNLYANNQKKKRPYNWVVVNTKGIDGLNKLVLLEISNKKDNIEIVHWHFVDERGLEKLKRQAEREDGQLLILPSDSAEEVGALSDPTLNMPSESKDTTSEPEMQEVGDKISQEEAKVNTDPTDGQKEAGNYKKGHIAVDGLNITIEQPKGSVRSGVDSDGKEWSVTMNNTYGYIRGTEGVDGDHIDVFLSDNLDNWDGDVFVVDQINADGSFDEHKVMYGFNSIEEAQQAYLSNYSEGWQGLGAITGVSKDEFKKWIASSHRKTKPFAEYKSVKVTEGQSAESVEATDDEKILFRRGEKSVQEEVTETIFATAKEKFGTTYDMREAGYILPDGSMLDFSGKHEIRGADTSFLNGQRSVDHRAIQEIAYDFDENETGVETDMGDFLDRGAIRIDYNTGAINLNVAPTKAQKDRLKRLIERNDGDVYIDFGKGWDTEHYVEYESARASRVLGDIDRYFNEGIKPSGNIRFRSAESAQPAPVFYSNAEYAVKAVKQEKATPEQWLKMIEKNGGLKAGEDKWLGLSDWLKASDKKTLTKQEVFDFIKENQIQIEEVEYAENPQGFEELKKEYDGWLRDGGYDYAWDKLIERYGYDSTVAFDDVGGELVVQYGNTASKLLGGEVSTINSTRLDYTTNGLDNKREIALTVPTIESWNESDEIHFGDAGNGRAIAWVRFGEAETYTDETIAAKKAVDDYLAEMRDKYDTKAGEETDAMSAAEIKHLQELTAKELDSRNRMSRVLVIDEIQSKRHQEGREKGYIPAYEERVAIAQDNLQKAEQEFENKRLLHSSINDNLLSKYGIGFGDASYGEINELRNAYENMQLAREGVDVAKDKLRRILRGERDLGIPTAPFEKNWAELAMKRMLRYAAENGFDKVAWTTGEQQADRYDLSKSVDVINAEHNEDGSYNINVATVDDSHFIQEKNIPESRLTELVGKDIALSIVKATQESEDGKAEIEGDNLRIGGSGMKAFYDQMIPSFMNKYGKKWGVKVQDVTLPYLEKSSSVMHSIDVTDAMRESVMLGQPMFRLSDNELSRVEELYDDIKTKYNVPGKIVVMPSREEFEQMLLDNGVPQEKLYDYDLAAYIPDSDTFLINGDGIKDTVQAEQVLFHEVLHKLTREVVTLSGLKWLAKNIPSNRLNALSNALWPNGYDSAEAAIDELISIIGENYIIAEKIVDGTPLSALEAYLNNHITLNEATELAKGIMTDAAKEYSDIWDKVFFETKRLLLHYKNAYYEQQRESRGEQVRGVRETMAKGSSREVSPISQTMLGGQAQMAVGAVGKETATRRAEQRQRAIVAEATDLASSLGVKLNVIEDVADITDSNTNLQRAKRGAKAWYDVATDQVYFVAPNATSIADAQESVLHEVVAHKGLRDVVGRENFNKFLDKVFYNAAPEIRAQIVGLAAKNGWNFRVATEEYLASLAERGFNDRAERTFWQKVRDLFIDMLREAKIAIGYNINDNDMRYMLWRTYQMQKSQGAMALAEDVLMQQKMGVGNFRTRQMTEEEQIVADAKANGTYLKAPNGKDTNLTPKQWVTVRTDAFKKWFGDWEKAARIEKLRTSKDATITGDEIEVSDDLKQYKKNAQLYGSTLQGEYTNADTGAVISLQRGRHNGGINEVLHHNYKDVAHLQSVAAIPQIIENGIYIESQPNKDVDTNPNVTEYQMFVCGLNIGGEDYTVLAKVAVDNNGNRYYDHNLVSVEKGKLIDIANNEQSAISSGFGTTPDTKSTTNSQRKYKELISLLQTNSSKIVDANGEPKVVYHETDWETSNSADVIFDKKKSNYEGLFFFSYNPSREGLEYGRNRIDVFLNVRNPKISNTYIYEGDVYYDDKKNDGGINKFSHRLTLDGEYEAVDGLVVAVKNSNQIKSATDNVGSFDANNDDIRFRSAKDETTTPSPDENADEPLSKEEKLQKDIKSLRKAVKGTKSIRKALAALVASRVRREVTDDIINAMGKSEFNALVKQIQDADVEMDIVKPLERISEIITDLNIKDKENKIFNLLSLKVQGKNKSGVSIAKSVDNSTRKLFNILASDISRPKDEIRAAYDGKVDDLILNMALDISEKYQQAKSLMRDNADINNEIKDVKEENTALRKQRAELNKDGKVDEAKALGIDIQHNQEKISALEAERLANKEQMEHYLGYVQRALTYSAMMGQGSYKTLMYHNMMHKVDMVNRAIRDVDTGQTLSVLRENPTRFEKAKENVRALLFSPARSLNYLLKRITVNAPNGEGRLYDYFVRGKNGYIAASENFHEGYNEFKAELNNKTKDIFGKPYKDVLANSDKPSDVTITVKSGDREQDVQLTIGQAMYLYMVNKMADGKVKLTKMGIFDADVEAVKNSLPARYITFADWLQNEFLPKKREKYNDTHLKVFGTEMASIDGYVPMKVKKDEVYQEVDGTEQDGDRLPTTITGSIINRRRNGIILDLTTNALDLMLSHGEEMEHWNAYTPVVRDMNSLLSNTKFKLLLNSRARGIYGDLKAAAQIAAGQYAPDTDAFSKAYSWASKGIISSKIAFRLWTAMKQMLSFPAFMAYSSSASYQKSLMKSFAKPYDAWKWGMGNLPILHKRWSSRSLGNEKLAEVTEGTFGKILDGTAKVGMLPNAFVDALTCAIGAKAVYDYKVKEYQTQMYSKEESEYRALIDATVAFNESQQSNEGLFLSQIQANKDGLSMMVSTFNNSNFGYLRKMLEAAREMTRKKDAEVAYLRDKYIEQGMSAEDANMMAEADVNKTKRTAVLSATMYGFLINTIWTTGSNVFKYLFTDDDDEDESLIKDVLISLGLSPVRNTAVGSWAESIVSGFAVNPSLLLGEVNTLWESIKADENKRWDKTIAYLAIKMASSMAVGADIETLVRIYEGIEGMIADGVDVEDIMALVSAPRSQALMAAREPKENESVAEYQERMVKIDRRIDSRISDSLRGTWLKNYYMYQLADKYNLSTARDDFGRVSIPEFQNYLDEAKVTSDREKSYRKNNIPESDMKAFRELPEYKRMTITDHYKKDINKILKDLKGDISESTRSEYEQKLYDTMGEMLEELNSLENK